MVAITPNNSPTVPRVTWPSCLFNAQPHLPYLSLKQRIVYINTTRYVWVPTITVIPTLATISWTNPFQIIECVFV